MSGIAPGADAWRALAGCLRARAEANAAKLAEVEADGKALAVGLTEQARNAADLLQRLDTAVATIGRLEAKLAEARALWGQGRHRDTRREFSEDTALKMDRALEVEP